MGLPVAEAAEIPPRRQPSGVALRFGLGQQQVDPNTRRRSCFAPKRKCLAADVGKDRIQPIDQQVMWVVPRVKAEQHFSQLRTGNVQDELSRFS